jgi:hypothetical protein
MPRKLFLICAQTFVLGLGTFGLGAASATAQTLEEDQEAAGGLGEPDSGGAAPADYSDEEEEAPPSSRLGDEQAEVEDEPTVPVVDPLDPRELPDTDYFFLGAMYRQVIIPGFIQQLFVNGGIDGINPGVGLTFNYRRNNFNVIANVWWNNAAADGYFRASGDPPSDMEYIKVDLFAVFIQAEFLWSFPVTDWFAIELGFDLGFGFVGGDLRRTEATESSPGAGDWSACSGPGAGIYCEAPAAPDPCYNNPGGHYNCREPNWFTEGGDTPFIMPWIALPHLAVRFKPIHQLQIRLDGGYGLYNFFFGGNVSYGF